MSEKLSSRQEAAEKAKFEVDKSKLESNREKLKNKAEKAEKLKSSEARQEASEAIRSAEKRASKEEQEKSAKSERAGRRGLISATDKKLTFKKTMRSIQSKMPAPTKAFSKVIHNPVVDKVSEVGGKTLARPSGVLGGGLAIVLGLGVSYYSAKNAGFELSGSEFIWLLLVGFVLGLIIEWIIKSIRAVAGH